MNLINEHTNVFWFCDNCVAIMKSSSLRDALSKLVTTVSKFDECHQKTLQDVKLELEKNRKLVESLCEKSSTVPPSTPTWAVKRNTVKRGRDQDDIATATMPNIPALVCGKKKFATEKIPATVALIPPSKKCWIYLGRFDPNVTEDNIRSLATECLSTDIGKVEVTKLVKKDANLSELQFVTFKIGVDQQYRDSALSAETWPDGIFFREFIDIERNILQKDSQTGFRKTPRLN